MLNGQLALAQAENSEGLSVHQRREAAGRVRGGRAENSVRSPGLTFALTAFSHGPFCIEDPTVRVKTTTGTKIKGSSYNFWSLRAIYYLVPRLLLMFCTSRDLLNSAGFIFITKYTCMKSTTSIIIAIFQLWLFLIPKDREVPVPWSIFLNSPL